MDNFNLKKYLAEGKLSLRKPTTLKEGKDTLRSLIQDLIPVEYETFADNVGVDLEDGNEMEGWIDSISDEDVKMYIAQLKGVNEDINSEMFEENDPFYKSDSYLDDPKPQRLGPSSQFTFEPSDPKKDLMIHKIVDEYQEKIFDYLWNYELYKNEYLKEVDEQEPRDGVKSAAEKLGMKPSHIKEEETDVDNLDKLLGKINTKNEYMELVPKIIAIEAPGMTSQSKKSLLLKIAKELT